MLHDIRKELEEWSRGKPLAVAMVAQQIVFSTDAVIGLLELLQADGIKLLRQYPVDRSRWLKLYTEHRSIHRAIVEFLGFFDWNTVEQMRATLVIAGHAPKGELRQELASISAEEWRAIRGEIHHFSKEFNSLHLESLLEGSELCDAEMEYVGGHITSTELQFFIRVVFPCWMLHGEVPLTLLWRATRTDKPDLAALEALIALDKEVVHHPLLARVLHPVDGQLERERMGVISKALASPPGKPVDRKRVKCCLAACISKLSEMLVHRLDASEIGKLFDIAAHQMGQLRDPDLPVGENFSKAIQRHRKFWESLPEPDKGFQEAVRALCEVFA